MNYIEHVYTDVNAGLLDSAFIYREGLNRQIQNLLEIDDKEFLIDDRLLKNLEKAIIIGNATYTNTDADILPIEDGVWDMMVEKYRKFIPDDSYPVGFKPTEIKRTSVDEYVIEKKKLFSHIEDDEVEKFKKMLYADEILFPRYDDSYTNYIVKPLFEKLDGYANITKRMTDTFHNHPDLVGTFDKCKFVLNAQAREKGVENNPNVRIMERDFFQPLLEAGLINMTDEITMIATIKYDGISVEADVNDRVISARTRGDAVEGKATDITPILGDYRFPKTAPGFSYNSESNTIGMKFEAIINNFNLVKLNQEKGYNYKNCRTAMTGIIGSSDGYKYRELITLVPISTDVKNENGEMIDRLAEIEYLNQYYTRDQLLRYAVLSGNYTSLLFQIKRFVEEAEFARTYLPFMYDGVVFEFYDYNIRKRLGRDNAMDRYKCAVKFNPLVKSTIFRRYEYTIGQDGTITPMICYDPIEFFGTTHPNSSGHSYNKFKSLDLHVGDIIDVTYINDVITYVTKPDNSHNRANANQPYTELDSFPTRCPACGSEITISDSGKSAKCPNIMCPERTVQRLTSSLARLGVVNFGEETVRELGYNSLYQFFASSVDDFEKLGENNKVEFKRQLDLISNTPLQDYKLFGSLGFNNIAEKTWKLIFNNAHWKELINGIFNGTITTDSFPNIKGIGPATIKTILEECEYFHDDIVYLTDKIDIVSTYGDSSISKQIRFTGCRDKQLEQLLTGMGYDCDGNSGVTKSTSILLVPYEGYNQGGKYAKAVKYGINIVPIQKFKDNMNQYL